MPIPLLWTVTWSSLVWSSHLQGILHVKLWMFHYQLQHQCIAFLLMLLSLYFPWKRQLLYYDAVLLQPNMIWILWVSSISQYALITLAFPATVKSSANATSLLLCLLIKMNLLRKWIKGVHLEHKLPLLLDLLVLYLPLILFYDSLQQIIWLVPCNNLQ